VTHELLLKIVDRIISAANSISTTERIQVSDTDADIFAMFWRARSLFEGIKALIQQDLADEAMLLARAIFEASLRIGEMRAARDKRAGLVLRWRLDSIQNSRGLMSDAHRTGIYTDADWAAADRALKQKEQGVVQYARSIGCEPLPKFRSDKDAAYALDRKKDYWLFRIAHEMVHGSEIAHMWRRRTIGESTVDVYAKTADIEAIAAPADFGGRALLLAAIDVAQMFGRGNVEEFRMLLSELEELEPPAPTKTSPSGEKGGAC
jgi:hypothetical protein